MNGEHGPHQDSSITVSINKCSVPLTFFFKLKFFCGNTLFLSTKPLFPWSLIATETSPKFSVAHRPVSYK